MSPKAHKSVHYNVSMVDKLWNLKRLCEVHLRKHIPLNMVIKDAEYRNELLEQALSTHINELVELVWDIRKMEDAILSQSALDKNLKKQKKFRTKLRLSVLTVVAFSFILFMGGYLLRSFLPMDAGEVFVFKVVQNARIESRLNVKNTAAPADAIVKADKPLFRLHGSNTIGEALAPRLVESYLASKGALHVHTEVGTNPVEKMVYGDVNGRTEFVEIEAHGSATAFTDLLKDKTDIGMSSRRIKEQERTDLLPVSGDLSTAGSEHIVGLDGLAIIVAASNEVSSLTLAQLVDIFSGKITRWSQLGGKDLPIKVFARDNKSGTWDSFKNLVLDPQKAELLSGAVRVESSTELSDAVAHDPSAIGFIGLPYVRNAKVVAVASSEKTIAIVPTHFTVSTEDYPLSRRLYLYTPQTNPSIEAEEFLRFAATDKGQQLVEDIGLISQNVKLGKPFNGSVYPEEMRELTLRSERLSVNFRFKNGSDELDSKALSDLDRVAKYVEVNAPRRVQLFGFSDGEGDGAKGKELSERRAKMVEQQLVRRGIYPLVVKGVGEGAPLASSSTESGKNINRRVEVWIL